MKSLICKILFHEIEPMYTMDEMPNGEMGPEYIDVFYCTRCLKILDIF